jgi:hypothetical protein
MTLPSTRRSSLDTFLPQFAPPIDDLTQPGTIPNGDNGRVDVDDRRSGINGHVASREDDLQLDELDDDSLSIHQNGVLEHPMFDTILDSPPTHLNGSSPVYAHSGTVFEPPAPVDDMADSDPSLAASRQFSVETNGHVGAIGDSFASPAAATELEDELEESVESEESRSPVMGNELPPHPAAGSLFTPYLVTEIRQLRNRRSRRSWWRRIFG